MNKTLLLTTLSAAAISLSASAQTSLIGPALRNGSYESTALATTTQVQSGFDSTPDVPFWNNTFVLNNGGITTAVVPAPYTNSGVRNDPGAGTTVPPDGTQFAFFNPADGSAFNLTTYVIQTGDQFTLTYSGRTGGGGSSFTTLFSTSDGTYGGTGAYGTSDSNVKTLAFATQLLTASYATYTLSYTALAADAGKTIGITYGNGTGAGFISGDNFRLTVVPEPSTYAITFAGLVGLVAMLRVRRIQA